MNLKRYEEATDAFSKAIEFAPVDKQTSLRDLRKQCVLTKSSSVPATSAEAPAPTHSSPTQAEVVLWKSIENSTNQIDFQVYLQQYPTGTFAGLAHAHLEKLQIPIRSAQEMYGIAYGDYEGSRFDLASNEFSELAKTYPRDPLEGRAEFYLGEIEVRQNNYAPAIQHFAAVVTNFPDSEKAPTAELHKAQAELAIKRTKDAFQDLQHLIAAHPETPEAALARSKLKPCQAIKMQLSISREQLEALVTNLPIR
jgi:tol-pal system protein YbgF